MREVSEIKGRQEVTALNKEEIGVLVSSQALIEDYVDLETQLTPNGFDLTVASISEFSGPGALDFSNKERIIPQGRELAVEKINPQDKFGWWHLKKGAYKIKTNETVNLPRDLIAVASSRSSLLRMGGFTQTAAWDAGFKGKSEFILVVDNPAGMRIKQNARIVQLLFMRINAAREGYQGIYQDTK
jgi:dUTP pyrophosphatase